MRVLYFSRDYTAHDHRFLSALAGTDHLVYYLRLERSKNQREDRALPEHVEQIQWAGGQKPLRLLDYPALVKDLRRVIRDLQPDIIHAGPIPTCGFMAALAGSKPLVSMSWGSDLLKEAEQSAWVRRAVRYALRHTTILVGDCQAVKDKAVSFGFPKGRVELFPWGVDLDHFTPVGKSKLRKRLGWEENFVLLSLRSWEPIYGLDVLIRAFAMAVEKSPELRLILLGNGSQAPIIHRLIAQHNLQEKIHLGGQVGNHDLPEIYRSADLYISASHSDGSSVSLMESLACGLPCLVSDIPGNKEWISSGKEGWLFPDGDTNALSEGMISAYKARKILPEMGQKARKLAEHRADWKANFQVLLTAYERARKIVRKEG
jgi:glycosyltransferase involved in cell wall biosynthesis